MNLAWYKQIGMIKEVEGDILLSKADAIAHGVAPMDHFDSGLALSLRENYPSMYKDFRHYCQTYHPKPGDLWLWQGVGGVKIFNLMTQEAPVSKSSNPGKASMSNVRHCFKQLVKELEKEEIKSIALPRVATGVGGLNWDEVRPMIDEYFGTLEIPVYVYAVYHKDVQAHE